jgi:two-component system, NtrC family, nitrogen regulation sensor histidine kinase NtrY
MSLALRLLLALGAVALVATALAAGVFRHVTRTEVQRGFDERITAATAGARSELVREAATLGELIEPQCKHDSLVDRTLLDLERLHGDVVRLAAERGIAIQRLVGEQAKALRLDGLAMVAGDGQVIGSTRLADVGTRSEVLGAALAAGRGARLGWRAGEPTLTVACRRASGDRQLGLVASRRIRPLLDRIGNAYGVQLGLAADPAPPPELMVKSLVIEEIGGLEVTAAISRQPLSEALAEIDASILLTGTIALFFSVFATAIMARSLSAPLVEMAEETREVLHGTPKPVRRRGSREMRELADAFNHAMEELSHIRRRLARTERIAARREVARQVAHEIKNPLAPIRAAVETLRRLRDRGSPQFDEYFDEATKTVLAEVHRIKTIVGEFAKYARMPPPRFAPVSLEEIARSVAALHDLPERTGGPRVSVEAEELPEVMADAGQLTQVLTNLVQNGIEAARLTSEIPLVTIAVRRGSDAEAVIEVRDNGPGVDPAVRERLFEAYVTTKPEGTGLGLAIVQTIVHEHGGEIRCLSEDEAGGEEGEHGAVFQVTLPIEGPPLLEQAPAITENPDLPE